MVRLLLMGLAFLLLAPGTLLAQTELPGGFGGPAFSNPPGTLGTGQQFGNIGFSTFSDGSTATRQTFGNIEFYSSSAPQWNGVTQSFGPNVFGTWGDGSISTGQTFGDTSSHQFSNGRICLSQRAGVQTLTTCR